MSKREPPALDMLSLAGVIQREGKVSKDEKSFIYFLSELFARYKFLSCIIFYRKKVEHGRSKLTSKGIP